MLPTLQVIKIIFKVCYYFYRSTIIVLVISNNKAKKITAFDKYLMLLTYVRVVFAIDLINAIGIVPR